MNCPFCNAEISESTKFCKKCGSRIPRCPSCGTVLKKRMRYCKNDGTPIPEEILQLFDKYSESEVGNVQDISPTVAVMNFKKDSEKKTVEKKQPHSEERPANYNTKRSRPEEIKRRPEKIEEQKPEETTGTETGNKGLIGLLVIFILTFTASIAGLVMLLSGGYVTLF